MCSFFNQKKLSYNLRKGPILNLPIPQSTYYGTILFTFEVLLYGAIFLLKLNSAIQFSNLKPRLKIWEISILDVSFASKLVSRQNLVFFSGILYILCWSLLASAAFYQR